MIDYFFYPKSIAVIGATANPKKFGNAVTINILKDKHPDINLFLISPNRTEILGIKCYASILDVKQDIDIAIILVPAKIVQSIIDECIETKSQLYFARLTCFFKIIMQVPFQNSKSRQIL